MPGKPRRTFQRQKGTLRYRRLCVIATEGTKTERQYFAMFIREDPVIHVKCLSRARGNSPPRVLQQMREYLSEFRLGNEDQAWIVVDKDQWSDEQLDKLHQWAAKADNYGLALSNPKFEYWLLLHFEDGNAVTTSTQCSHRLCRYLADYEKGIDRRKFSDQSIKDAIARAKKRDNPPCIDWPRIPPGTTVYRLVELIALSK